jgi:uncharacterized protein YndB with AHSA1/START domain
MGNESVHITRTYDALSDAVWTAITDPAAMRQWYFDISEFTPEVGFEFRFVAGTAEQKWVHLCRVTEVVTGRKLGYTWRYEGYDGISEVSFVLFPEGLKTRLTLTHTGLETFPRDRPEFARESFIQGWTSILEKSLKGFVEADPAHRIH